MLSILVCAVMGQFKVGDEVQVFTNAQIYSTPYDAILRQRYTFAREDYIGKVIAVEVIDGEQVVRVRDSKRESPAWALAEFVRAFDAAAKADHEQRKAAQIEFDNRRREIEADPEMKARMEKFAKEKEAEDKARAKAEKDKADATARVAGLRQFVRTEPEKEAYDLVIKKGWDPLNLTPIQVNTLTPSQRKAISGIKMRYVKATAKRPR